MQKQPIKPGFVCPSTGRVAVLVKQYAKLFSMEGVDLEMHRPTGTAPRPRNGALIRGDWWKVSIRTPRANQWMFVSRTDQPRRLGH